MDWLDPAQVQAGVACLVACAALGWVVPVLIDRIPEPEPEPVTTPADESDPALSSEPRHRRLFERSLPEASREKVLYAEIAAAPRLGWWTAAWAGLIGAAFGAALGWTGALLYLVP